LFYKSIVGVDILVKCKV